MAGGARNRSDPAHEGATNAQYMDVHRQRSARRDGGPMKFAICVRRARVRMLSLGFEFTICPA